MEEILKGVWDMKNVMEDYKNMLCCVYEVLKAILEENKRISLDITCMGTRMDDLESGYRVQVGEVD